jgi:hypothetical protein
LPTGTPQGPKRVASPDYRNEKIIEVAAAVVVAAVEANIIKVTNE